MKTLVTGCAGFIGMHTCLRLLKRGDDVVGIDNLNDYYDVRLKEDRLAQLSAFNNFSFLKLDMTDHDGVSALFARQDPNGAYAAVIPKWIASMIKGEPVYINGDGETSRDFCFIENARQINLLAATVSELPLPQAGEGWGEGASSGGGVVEEDPTNQVYNVAVGDRTTLNQLYEQLHLNLLPRYSHLQGVKPVYRDFRAGDVRHSLADISKASKLLGFQPTHRIGEGLKVAMEWYIQHLSVKS